jgi:diaminopimelate epimerase
VHLTKHHGLGNDFLIALVEEVPQRGADFARSWCHRTTGIGADGLIFGTPTVDADLEMTLFNSDGSYAEISGNGIRCLAQAHFGRHGVGNAELNILAGGDVRQLRVMSDDGPATQIAVDMGAVGDGPHVPSATEVGRPGFDVRRVETGDVGNPHVVLEVDDLGSVELPLDGPALEAMWKPEGINVHFLNQSGSDEITLMHWERGAGATAACGSGAVVAATVANRWGLVGDDVRVKMPGGDGRVLVGARATLIGPAVFVARIEVPSE